MFDLAHQAAPGAAEILPEQALLGLIFADHAGAASAMMACPPALFRDPFHRRIYEAMRDVGGAGDAVTPLRVRAKLKGDPAWLVMPSDYLETLKMASPATAEPGAIVRTLRREILEQASTPDRKVFCVRSIAGLKETAALPYWVKGLIAPADMSVIFGEPGTAKTFIALFIAYLVSLGCPVFGRRVRQTSVLYLALEGHAGFERRLQALRDKFGPSERFHWIVQPVDLYGGIGDAEGIVSAALHTEAGLVVVDTLARAMSGGSENDGRDMGMVIAGLDLIRRETGAHVAVVHHSGKDSTKGMRGHSSLLAAADMAMELKRPEGGSRSLRIVKAKDDIDGCEHAFDLEVVDLGTDDDGDVISTCVVAPNTEAPTQRRPKVNGQAKLALDALTRAVADEGQPAPVGTHFERDIRVVSIDVWRKHFYAGMGHERDTPEADRKAFQRVRVNLKTSGFVGIWQEFAWLLQ